MTNPILLAIAFQQGYDAGYAIEGYSRPCPFRVAESVDRAEWHAGYDTARKDRAAQLEREDKRKEANG